MDTKIFPPARRKSYLDFAEGASPAALKAAFDAKVATIFTDPVIYSIDHEETFQKNDGSYVTIIYYSESFHYTPDAI